MNPRAIDDLLGTVLASFYHSAAAWAPPGELSDRTCATCSASLLSETIEIWRWPHDLMHRLAVSLSTVVDQVEDSLEDSLANADRCEPARGDENALATAIVRSAIIQHRADVLDVLAECVEPGLHAYLESECSRGIDDAARWVQGHLG